MSLKCLLHQGFLFKIAKKMNLENVAKSGSSGFFAFNPYAYFQYALLDWTPRFINLHSLKNGILDELYTTN